jgi:hypothetical protein
MAKVLYLNNTKLKQYIDEKATCEYNHALSYRM